ncbi:MAG TPA: CHAT domain-containing tetratricopeptide repeat protein [Alphaproteobacteria bacterium]|nr:CHAT domain-containing tetratricopeptide repeat protein [Alphaproteobacteria bacterium]
MISHVRHHVTAAALVGGLLAAAVCGTARAALSLDEAIKTVDQYRATVLPPADNQGQDAAKTPAAPAVFVPPPRTISDITAILDKQKPDPAKRAAATAAADAQPPASGSNADIAEFYYRRGLAAGEIGRAPQRVEDLKKAYELGRQANLPPQRINFYLQQLGRAYSFAGKSKEAAAIQDERLALLGQQTQGRGAIFNIYRDKIGNQVAAGQIDEARATMALAERELQGFVRRGPNGPSEVQRYVFRDNVLEARATLLGGMGRYAESEAALREGLEIVLQQILPNVDQLQNPPGTFEEVADGYHSGLAKALMAQNRLIEAEAEIRTALLDQLRRRGRYAAETGNAILLLARVLDAQGRYVEAEKMAVAAEDIYRNIGHGTGSAPLANARALLAQVQSWQGKFEATRATYDALERDIGQDPALRSRFLDANQNYAITLLRSQRGPEAIKIIETIVARHSKNLGEKAYFTAESRGFLGLALARTGQNDRAAQEFAAAMPILMSSSREADGDDDGGSMAKRDQQMQVIAEAYMALLADTRGSGAAAETFHLAEAVRGRSVERALAASAARAAVSDPRLADLARHEQDAQKQTAALQGLLTNVLSQPTSEQDPGAVKKLRQQIDQLRDARARLREEIEQRFPDYANLIDPRPATVEQAQKSLRPGEALVATYVGRERLFVWAVPQQGPTAFAASKIGAHEVETMVANLRKSLDPNASTLDEVPAFDVALANKLYDAVLKPVESGWASAQNLLIVPDKALGQIPLSLLVTQPTPQPAKAPVMFAEYKAVPFLVRKVAVAQLPAVTSLATLRALPAPKEARRTFIGFGDPWFSAEEAREAQSGQVADALQTRGAKKTAGLQTRGLPLRRRSAPATEGVDSAQLANLPRLPDTAEEVRSIALALRADLSTDVFVGAAANEKNVETADLAHRRIIVFATHGLVPGDLNGLTQPALALSAPDVAHVPGDGLLTVDKILALKLNADWVVLSACNTASGQGAGAEAVSGLGRAFFYAGTRALLVSNWPVETISARTLTTDLFHRQADNPQLGRSQALREAELALIDGQGSVDPATKQPQFSYAHPIFWAPFAVVGDGGTTIQ